MNKNDQPILMETMVKIGNIIRKELEGSGIKGTIEYTAEIEENGKTKKCKGLSIL